MPITHFVKLKKPKRSNVYDTYWQFADKRFKVFVKRISDSIGPWTDDPIICKNRFTNVFRASDRVSQYLINLQYQEEDLEEILFKTIIFKIFNKIETYNYLEKELKQINSKSFSIEEYNDVLTKRLSSKKTIYSAAYIMPSPGNVFGYKYKHTNHLALISKMIKDNLSVRILECKSLEEVYKLLLSYPSIGNFLAFQYSIDINYSVLTNFSEMDFVVAGPGAKNGILKCFESLGDYTFEDTIKLMADEQKDEFERLGIMPLNLWGRPLQLIDCQNLFCEVDKYLRVSNPEIGGNSKRTRIKQKFKVSRGPISLFFPPKWNINEQINTTCQKEVKEGIFL